MEDQLPFIAVLLVQILDHGVFVLNVLFYSVQVLGGLAEVLLLLPVDGFFSSFGGRQDVFDRVGHDEVFSGT
jgi:hypothetical protein